MATGATAEVTISNPQGMHLRPATEFARLVQATGCAVRVRAGEAEANGASVLELAMMAAGQGTLLVISAEGEGCEKAVASLVELVRNDFRH
jgi:phosphotransferase system HPr (HPr) family protein